MPSGSAGDSAVVALQTAVPDASDRVDTAQTRAFARAVEIREAEPDSLHEEVRVAMALNGGVSLAVWMGGVAVELDAARRAHLGTEPATADEAERTVYHALCTAFARSLVLDILSGASAGGLNGALLAAAIRKGRQLSPTLLRRKWIKIGNFLTLLQPMSRRDPPSLMRGGSSKVDEGVFYKELRTMFGAVLDTDDADDAERIECNSPQSIEAADAVLDVMMTNVRGEPRRFRDVWGFELAAREYRSPLQFRNEGHFTVDNLAAAARVSASFPVAFEPFKVEGAAARLASLPRSRYGIDGGLLENAPIDAAIRLIPTRPAHTQVKRFVCYLNAAPPSVRSVDEEEDAEKEQPNPQPQLADVLGYVVNLPRDARFVDQLYAVRDASRRALVASTAQPELLKTQWGSLEATALALMPSYRRRRCILTLEELLTDPSDAEAAFATVSQAAELPWLPTDLEVPKSGSDWNWGIRAAERILYLELDLLRGAINAAPDDDVRRELLATRIEIDAGLATLATLRESFVRIVRAAADAKLDPLTAIQGADLMLRKDAYDALLSATKTFIGVAEAGHLGEISDPDTVGGAIFGAVERATAKAAAQQSRSAWLRMPVTRTQEHVEPVDQFLRRALATEVVRRAFSADEDIEPGQQLLFAQITPLAPTRIFTARPFDATSAPDSGNDKLTGILFMHFSGFYRSSWRANDFMWGRLDGAAQIVDLLIDTVRAQEMNKRADADTKTKGGHSRTQRPAVLLRDALLPGDAADTRHALVEEAFRDACRKEASVAPPVKAVLAGYAADPGVRVSNTADLAKPRETPTKLRDDLLAAFEADLQGGDALFTRVVCARALQLEILRAETKQLTLQTSEDEKLGCFTSPLQLSHDARTAISQIRGHYANGGSLPKVLGRDSPDEATSDLALQTLAHTLFVALAALRGVNVVLGKIVAVGRAPLLPVSGIASRRPLDRLAVWFGLAAAATYIAARIGTANEDKAPLGSLWSPPVLLSWIALLGIAGVVLVPTIRAFRTKNVLRRVIQAAFALAIAALAVLVPVALSKWEGGHGFAEIAATPGGYGLPSWLMWWMFGAVLGSSVVLRFPFVPAAIKTRLQPLADKIPLTYAIGIPAGLVAGWASAKLADIASFHSWQGCVAISAFACLPLFGLYLLFGSRR